MPKPSRFLPGLIFALLLTYSVLSAAAQEPTPGWNNGWRNADGSLKLALEFGGGYDTSAGAARTYQGAGWNYRMGAGYRLNRRFAALVEYNYDHFRIPAPLLNADFNIVPFVPFTVVGSVHDWSMTLEPTFNYFATEHLGGYLIGGGGFYRKVTALTQTPQCVGQTQLLYRCKYLGPNPTDHISNNAGGANLGAGFSWRVWDNSNTKLFVEGRYVWVDNSPSPNNTVFPPANKRTGYYPVTGGVRW